MTERHLEQKLSDWLLREAVNMIDGSLHYRILKLAAVPGDPEFAKQALSITLQVSFPSLSEASAWGRDEAPRVLEAYSKVFGQQALHFSSVLKELASREL